MSKPVVIEIVTTLPAYSKPVHFRAVITPHDPVTKCIISSQVEPIMADYWGLESVGIGVRKHGDAYDRETGCRMALTSALRQLGTKSIRKSIWDQYLALFPIAERTKPEERTFTCTITLDASGYMDHLRRLRGALVWTGIKEVEGSALEIGRVPNSDEIDW